MVNRKLSIAALCMEACGQVNLPVFTVPFLCAERCICVSCISVYLVRKCHGHLSQLYLATILSSALPCCVCSVHQRGDSPPSGTWQEDGAGLLPEAL